MPQSGFLLFPTFSSNPTSYSLHFVKMFCFTSLFILVEHQNVCLIRRLVTKEGEILEIA